MKAEWKKSLHKNNAYRPPYDIAEASLPFVPKYKNHWTNLDQLTQKIGYHSQPNVLFQKEFWPGIHFTLKLHSHGEVRQSSQKYPLSW